MQAIAKRSDRPKTPSKPKRRAPIPPPGYVMDDTAYNRAEHRRAEREAAEQAERRSEDPPARKPRRS